MDPYVYQYSIGTLIFAIGLYYAYRHDYIGFSGRKLAMLIAMISVLLLIAGFQGYLEYAEMAVRAPQPYAGGAERSKVLGTPLDYGIMIAYFVAILLVGTWFGRRQKTVKDFFFGGQRFSWWLIAFSMVATTIGSYSFVKYSRVAFSYGVASSQTYLNDWFWVPLLAFGWLPILYFSRVSSIPEYFERRFDRRVRIVVSVLMLVYLVGYVGVNLFTMGKALHILLGWPIWGAAVLVAVVSAIYVTAGGQTSVIMTDLLQGVMLIATGGVIFWLGADYMGGLSAVWENMPREMRTAFTNFNTDPGYNSVGIFWQDGMANTAMFYFLNQGLIMRFLSAKSVQEGRKAIIVVPIVLMPIAAATVASGGWVGRALVNAGTLPPNVAPDEVFFVTAEFLSRPGVFGLIMAALTAALMSTVDTLITAVAAIAVNDFYRPFIKPDAGERDLLKVARWTSVSVTLLGILLVPVFMTFKSIYAAHGAFTAGVTPPLVVAFFLAVFWRRFTSEAALATLVGGSLAILLSVVYPEVITPFAHGVPMQPVEEGLFAGMKQYQFMRAFYGLTVSAVIGVAVTFMTKAKPLDAYRGLVWGTIQEAIDKFKGAPGSEHLGENALARAHLVSADREIHGEGQVRGLAISRKLADELHAVVGDLIYVTDRRGWLGGLHSAHGVVDEILEDEGSFVELGPDLAEVIITKRRQDELLRVERLY